WWRSSPPTTRARPHRKPTPAERNRSDQEGGVAGLELLLHLWGPFQLVVGEPSFEHVEEMVPTTTVAGQHRHPLVGGADLSGRVACVLDGQGVGEHDRPAVIGRAQ